MDTNITCSRCGSDNRASAKYCDQCGAALGAAAPAAASEAAAAAPARGTNWTAIIVVLAVIAVAGWLLFGPKGNGGQPAVMAGGSSADNPHAGESAANPHGATPGMEDVTAGIATSKENLAADPLDIESLHNLYQSYGMIGRGQQLRPYLDAAVEALDERAAELGDQAGDIGLKIAMAAVGSGGDNEGGRMVLLKVNELEPDNLLAVKMLGDLEYNLENFASSIDWYTQYVEAADPDEQGNDYWSARIDRATMYLRLGEETADESLVLAAVDELTEITELQPDSFDALFNLGNAVRQAGDEAEAERIWEGCRFIAAQPDQQWRVAAALAELRGEEIPPRPEPGQGGMGMMGNPHSGGGGAPAGDA